MVPSPPYPKDFTLPKFDRYKGSEDPKEHISSYAHQCFRISTNDALLLRTFPQTLGGDALDWYNHLPNHSIHTFEQLAAQFLDKISLNVKRKMTLHDLVNLKQYDEEPMLDYGNHWRGVLNKLTFVLPTDELIRIFLRSCLKPISLLLQINQYQSLEEALAQARLIEDIKV